ncbi:hypothetical protein, partial [Escherichia coli]|uniref:hypothetical protein n=1 Tax=Escherichia coli TaxID=562 RepID=UPI0030797629
GLRKFHQGVTEGAFPVNWIIDKGLGVRGGMQISYDATRQNGRRGGKKISNDYLARGRNRYFNMLLINFPN